MKNETVEISKGEYFDLLVSQEKLIRLEQLGVDNWCGYSEALSKNEDQNDFQDEIELIKKAVKEMDRIQY